MFAQYFGQFLLNRDIVSAAQLDRAMTVQKETRLKLGVLAINYGYMTADQVETVHQAQTRMDKRFGEIAVELGFLREETVELLLSSQQKAHLTLGQALIDQEALTYETLEAALQQYKLDYSLSDEQFESIMSGSIETLLEALLLKEGGLGSRATVDYVSLFAKNMIRFIDADIRMEIAETAGTAGYAWLARQPLLSADREARRLTAFAGDEASFLRIASGYAQEPVEEAGEMMEASVGEFLNLHNGIYLVNRSNEGTELEMDPQEVVPAAEAAPASEGTVIRVIGSSFRIDLLIEDLSALG